MKKKTRDLFLALWIPDNFMSAVKNNKKWYLMCPDECPGLNDNYGKINRIYIINMFHKENIKRK